ncbi:hypothetical protein A3D84_01200 [Candidatus Woesebacteria bacterium RIFCSPHIGHO2_02_FULL_42_20]|uniref:Uncharacterized protein n=1 Tax=Candidatus Woesebacteria bacterium RIFCSPHIGHO2_12_FULL_41_24 TaxID=1802510 RepID=A0A1F8AQ80_9BACT|nr:MAG: hypothetical protein A2873_01320 [Candidatus Woesebacteria bacterium RIFCSPHIGHO2_01_FULL_42_80]OGM35869.1 MAG: hypothetical protein A3D84_01200 [Candidatus Woesebacteria bacterium RIFCSPHIGHO2_02_FULL_42_20]OGM53927.1 MAG: hypothetical protein A3E44_05965 [Candidatus Woesebacteria bacterium RIFCSPHIGHO2_12_FULL_41_24]OGM66119.1 MAG: hypothetical protein A2969_04060 [Candidatus Woesebacteria bacterium RIFCSPLOWO2_01_FULL_42_67]OGM71054.1 MAG: hypothetical protein A3I55_01785 [Candidatus
MSYLVVLSTAVLLLANAIPILGVYLFSWTIQTLAVIYWLEAGIQGFFGLIKLFRTQGSLSGKHQISTSMLTNLIKLPLIPLFALNFFVFLVVYGILLYFLIGIEAVQFSTVLAVYAVFFVSHTISYYLNFIKSGEFKKVSPVKQLFEPYRRYGLTHLAVLMGVFLAKSSGAGHFWALLTALVKTIVDASLHIKEHKESFNG